MKLTALLRLSQLGLKREKRATAFAAFGVAVGVGSLVFFVALGLGVDRVAREQVFPLDASLVDVAPPAVAIGSILGGGKLDQATVDRLAALPEVAESYRKMEVRVPSMSRYDGDFFGAPLRMAVEMVAVGMDKALVEGDLKLGDFRDPGPGRPVPVVISRRLLEIYNKSFAPTRKLPFIGPDMLVGFVFPLDFNRSMIARVGPGPALEGQAEVVGVSDRVPLVAVTIPLESARRINRATGTDAETFSGVTLRAKDPSLLPRITEAVHRMGLKVDDQERKLAENAGLAVALTTSALALLSALICVLAAVNIAQTLFASVRARAREIGVMRAVGASRADIRLLVFCEAGMVGLMGGALGTGLSVLAGFAADGYARSWLPPFPFKPDRFFCFPWQLLVCGVALGTVAAMAGAYFPGRHAARADPAQTLAG
jgi:ABC-type antimicrobial peptide transport system permease subunit